jgi:hypothetical protein
MQKSLSVLLVAGALFSSTGVVFAQGPIHQAPTQAPTQPLPGFTTEDPRPGMPGGSPASSGSNVGSNIGAGATAAPVGNDVTPPGAAPDIAAAPQTRPLFGLSRQLPLDK